MKITTQDSLIFAETSQFKTNLITIRFFSTITPANATPYAILPDLLTAGTKKYPTRRALHKVFEDLYDTRLRFNITRQGPTRILQVSVEYLQDQYLLESIEEQAIQLLYDVLYDPHTVQGCFEASAVEREKRLFLEEYEARFEDKSYVSHHAFKKVVFDNDMYGIDVQGSGEDVATITPEVLWQTYQEMIQSPAQIVVVGTHVPRSLDRFHFAKNTFELVDHIDVRHDPVNYHTQIHHTKQAMLQMAYTTPIRYDEALYYPMLLLDSILGGDQSSLLFVSIREEHHLAYSVYSNFQPAKGILSITAGLQASTIPKAFALAQEQITKLLQGDFSQQMIDAHKKMWAQQVKTVFDTPAGIAAKLAFDASMNRPLSMTNAIDQMNRVTKEEIIASAKTLRLDTVFALAEQEVVWND